MDDDHPDAEKAVRRDARADAEDLAAVELLERQLWRTPVAARPWPFGILTLRRAE